MGPTRTAPPPENVGAAASRIFDGTPAQAGSPAEFYCSRPKTVRAAQLRGLSPNVKGQG